MIGWQINSFREYTMCKENVSVQGKLIIYIEPHKMGLVSTTHRNQFKSGKRTAYAISSI